MLKITALLSVGIAFFLGGRYLAWLQSEKLAVLRDAVMMISAFRNNLRYSKPPLIEILRLVSESDCGRLSGFMNSCTQAVACGMTFPKAWRESIENESELCRLLGNQRDNLIKLGEMLGTTDADSQISSCDCFISLFEAEIEIRREQSERSLRLFPPLGALLGVTAVIFLV